MMLFCRNCHFCRHCGALRRSVTIFVVHPRTRIFLCRPRGVMFVNDQRPTTTTPRPRGDANFVRHFPSSFSCSDPLPQAVSCSPLLPEDEEEFDPVVRRRRRRRRGGFTCAVRGRWSVVCFWPLCFWLLVGCCGNDCRVFSSVPMPRSIQSP